MPAKIYKPARNAMQSGEARTKFWLLEFDQDQARFVEPLMGWTGSSDTRQQVKLWFETQDEAVAYATRHGIPYQLFEPKEATSKTMSYSDNFKTSRIGQWTH